MKYSTEEYKLFLNFVTILQTYLCCFNKHIGFQAFDVVHLDLNVTKLCPFTISLKNKFVIHNSEPNGILGLQL